MYDLLAWLEVNKSKIGIAAAVLIALGFIVATARYMARQKEEKASAQLLALKPALTPATNTPPPQASALLKVANDFKGTTAAERALLLAASAYFTSASYGEAEKEFNRFLQEYPASPWAASAAYGVAASQEAGNKANEAFASYQKVITAYAASPVVREAKLSLARIYEQRNQPDQALRLYNELAAAQPGAAMGQGGDAEAETRKEALLRQHPTLNTNRIAPAPVSISAAIPAATNAPVAATNAPVAPAPTNAPAKP